MLYVYAHIKIIPTTLEVQIATKASFKLLLLNFFYVSTDDQQNIITVSNTHMTNTKAYIFIS